MHQQNPVDAPPESRGTTRIRRTPTESCLHLQRAYGIYRIFLLEPRGCCVHFQQPVVSIVIHLQFQQISTYNGCSVKYFDQTSTMVACLFTCTNGLKSSPPGTAYMRQWIGSSLEPMLAYCQSHSLEYWYFHSNKIQYNMSSAKMAAILSKRRLFNCIAK